jgi:hypothetical protein
MGGDNTLARAKSHWYSTSWHVGNGIRAHLAPQSVGFAEGIQAWCVLSQYIRKNNVLYAVSDAH